MAPAKRLLNLIVNEIVVTVHNANVKGNGGALMYAVSIDKIKAGHLKKSARFYYFLVRPKRFELLTPWFVAKYSIQLSYGRMRDIIV